METIKTPGSMEYGERDPGYRPEAQWVLEPLKKATIFLYREQLPWGEFVTYSYLADEKGSYGSSPFATTFVLHALSFVPQTGEVTEMRLKGVRFLLEHREEPGIWRYYGKNVGLTPDVDDSACALAALKELGLEVNPQAFEMLLQCRRPETKLFQTWMGTSPVFLENDVDCIVNANVLFLSGLLKQSESVQEVVEYLVSESTRLHTQNTQVWYYSPYMFTYAVSRAYTDGGAKSLAPAGEHIRRYLLLSQEESGGWRNHLDTACAIVSLLNLGCKGCEVERAVGFLVDQQAEDGSWDEAMFNFPFASREITTALCIEALSKFAMRPH